MRDPTPKSISLAAAGLAAGMMGASFMVSGAAAQDLHLQPGTDCSTLLYTEQKACAALMRRYEQEQWAKTHPATGQQPSGFASPVSPYGSGFSSLGFGGGSGSGGGAVVGIGGN